jgi:hypothetical protein
MNIQKREVLFQFFASYFHEDWRYVAANEFAAVSSYLQTAKVEEVVRLRDAIIRFANSIDDDAELGKLLFSKLGCYHSPSANGQSAREWLLYIAELLKKNDAVGPKQEIGHVRKKPGFKDSPEGFATNKDNLLGPFYSVEEVLKYLKNDEKKHRKDRLKMTKNKRKYRKS